MDPSMHAINRDTLVLFLPVMHVSREFVTWQNMCFSQHQRSARVSGSAVLAGFVCCVNSRGQDMPTRRFSRLYGTDGRVYVEGRRWQEEHGERVNPFPVSL